MRNFSPGDQTTGVIWITGYSASGKTSVGRKLKTKLLADGVCTIFLDGDDLRSIFADRWGYERAERIELSKVYFRLCSHLASKGHTVVISAVSMYDEVRAWLKENVPNAIEAYLDVPEEERRQRDRQTKGLYDKQDFEKMYDAPQDADVVIRNYGDVAPENAANTIREFFYAEGLSRTADRGKKKHWDEFYALASAPVEPSPFSRHVAEEIGANSSLLEVGCGNGRDAWFFGSLGHHVVALDASQGAIDFCLDHYKDQSMQFVCGTVRDLVAEHEQEFDVVYSRFCIHAMTRPEENEFINTASRLLKSSGKMFIECRSITDPLARKGEVISLTERIWGHYRRFIILDELENSLCQAGFEILQAIESKGLARFGDEDPVVIRVVATPRQSGVLF